MKTKWWTAFVVGLYCVVGTIAQGEEQVFSVPVAIYIENAYTFAPQNGVTVTIQVRQPNGRPYRFGVYKTDAQGVILLSLLPSTVYQITSQKDGYFSQLTLLETKNLSRTGKNRFNISLRPKECFRLQGQLQRTIGEESYFTLTNLATKATQKVRILSDGRYYACGACGETYRLEATIGGQVQQPDTIYLDPRSCMEERSPIMRLSVQPIPILEVEPIKEEPEEITSSLLPSIGDSLIVENLVFEGKTKRLGEAGRAILEELITILAEDSNLVVKLLIHTDARKSERYNWLLAERRGELLRRSMEARGIDPRRYCILPIGEKDILNHCTNNKSCTAKEHRINNRVELIRYPNGVFFEQKE